MTSILSDWSMLMAGIALVVILGENALAVVGGGGWFGRDER